MATKTALTTPSDVTASMGVVVRNFPVRTHGSLEGTGGVIGRHWGLLGPPSGRNRDEQWTVCRDMIRGCNNGLRAHFTRAKPYQAAGCCSGNRAAARANRVRYGLSGST